MKQLKVFHISSIRARKRGAIGIFYHLSDIVHANSHIEAETIFRLKYESNAPLTITDTTTPTTDEAE